MYSMYYHFAILLLFRPFIKLDIIGSSVAPRDVCSQAADAISALVNSYSQLYTLERTPSFTPHFVLASGVMHLVSLGQATSGPDPLLQNVIDLKDMAVCHGFAARSLDVVKFLVGHWGVSVPLSSSDYARDPDRVCGPSTTSTNLFCPNFGVNDIMSSIDPLGLSQIRNVENPLFWPFPLQGRPMLEAGPLLGKSGFEFLGEIAGDDNNSTTFFKREL